VLNEAWFLFKQQSGAWIGATCLAGGVVLILYIATLAILMAAIGPTAPGGGVRSGPPNGGFIVAWFVMTLGGWIVGSLLTAGFYNMAIKQVRGEIVGVPDLFSVTPQLPSILGATILTGLASLAGAILCYFPVFIVNGLLMFTIPLVVDKKLRATEAMRLSWDALKPDMWMATLFMFIMPMVASLGMMACLVGLVVTLPLYFLAIAITYRNFFIPQPPPSYGYPPAGYPQPNYTPESAYPPPANGPLDFSVTPPPVEEENRPPKPDETG
jgi:uncharacterized membrane protein